MKKAKPKKRHKWKHQDHSSKCERCGILVRWAGGRGPKGGMRPAIQFPPTRGFITRDEVPECTA